MQSSTRSARLADLAETICRSASKRSSSIHRGAFSPSGTRAMRCRNRASFDSLLLMCSRISANVGAPRPAGGLKVVAQPTCMCAVGLSTVRNDASSGDSLVADMLSHPSNRIGRLPHACGSHSRSSSGPLAGCFASSTIETRISVQSRKLRMLTSCRRRRACGGFAIGLDLSPSCGPERVWVVVPRRLERQQREEARGADRGDAGAVSPPEAAAGGSGLRAVGNLVRVGHDSIQLRRDEALLKVP
jgi:hypothetical protein